ncbi:MAG: hypothetical protein LBF36_01320 [Mycoplasmataceae bacterium]|nr:hypothetical protein [Mycoplasmataceae bacterium]
MRAFAKVNLILKVLPKKKQEIKHRIKSLFCLYPKLYDEIYIKENNTTTISFKYQNKPIQIDKSKMLLAIQYCAKLLNRKLNLQIVVQKKIPIMSGLGGSATDIACVMKWIMNKYGLQLSAKHLKFIALNVGSDVPFFLSGYSSAWVSNYGDKVIEYTSILPKFRIILTNIKMNTTKVYQSISKNYVSKVNVQKSYQILNSNHFCKDTIYNDMWVFANKLNQKLCKFSHHLSSHKNIILSGSGGSFIEILKER